ncbi:Lrp/AsnC family transcriptional regulator [Paenibacillus peoriae]|uniref:Lrp/AsnC family transcriptional regulator n=1 Tax=Paenibacillus peoriae TaxID=59893 RepID=UPI00096D9B1A|nr:Lrp/AsnC family transcriptional regulator [Paenibacillus peoriae]OMF50692.1 transcriptional regulator [Paenibacillus peoriae]
MELFVPDNTDLRIIHHLIEDSSLSNKEIGQLVHLTGQAVGARVRKMQDAGIIEGYTLRWNPEKIGQTIHAFITVFLNSGTTHSAFQAFAREHPYIVEIHRVSGEGCYWMRLRMSSQAELNTMLDELTKFGNYKLSFSIGEI